MADDAGGEGSNAGPQLVSDPALLLMDDVYMKLQLLGYRDGFCLPRSIPPLHRAYFALPAPNTAVQFFTFLSLASWLLGLCRRRFQVDQMEDPASAVGRLLGELREVGLDAELPPTKLRAGHGEAVVQVISFLCDRAAEARGGFRFFRPNYAADDTGIEDVEEVGGGLVGDDEEEKEDDDDAVIEDDGDGASSPAPGRGRLGSKARDGEDDDADVLYKEASGAAAGLGGVSGAAKGSASDGKAKDDGDDDDEAGHAGPQGILEATVDPAAWRAEVERVAPRLGEAGGPGGASGASAGAGSLREWRAHIDQTQAAQGTISKILPDTRSRLERVSRELSEALDAIVGKERFLGSSYKALCREYNDVADKCHELQAAFTSSGGKVSSLTNELANVNDALEDVRVALEERSGSVSDTSPLIKIKAALSTLRAEVRAMDLQIGVLGYHAMQPRKIHGPAGVPGGKGGKKKGVGDEAEEEESEGEA